MAVFDEKDFSACCGSSKFAQEMVLAGPFSNYHQAVDAARDVWFNKVDVNGWLEAFASNPQIGQHHSEKNKSPTSAQWSKDEQSTALTTATDSSLKELLEWNLRYREKFGFVFLICASGRSTSEILTEIKRRYPNKPIVEFEIAAHEQMKITELRLAKLFSAETGMGTRNRPGYSADIVTKAGEDRMNVSGGHLIASDASTGKASAAVTRTKPPITTHVLDTARGIPAAGVEVQLETWVGNLPPSTFSGALKGGQWKIQGCSVTDKDGRSGQLISMVDELNPGIYRISFNTGKYNDGNGFFPYVSIVFEVKESQKLEHFHVPLLLSPFSFSTYRGS